MSKLLYFLCNRHGPSPHIKSGPQTGIEIFFFQNQEKGGLKGLVVGTNFEEKCQKYSSVRSFHIMHNFNQI